MRRRRMGAIPIDPHPQRHHHHPNLNLLSNGKEHGPVVEEIEGLIRVFKDGYVHRLPVMPEVPPICAADSGVACRDLVVNQNTGVWARFYLPKRQVQLLPLLVYFHGGGFCVGSAAWSCYHEFITKFAVRVGCAVLSVNYRLAPENRLPAAFEDGVAATRWLLWQQQQQQQQEEEGDPSIKINCDFSRVFVGGDSAGAAVAYQVAARVGSIRGLVLIQPFFGGETRTSSEKSSAQPVRSALSLAASDCYWRLALPPGANRDHRWCNPLSKTSPELAELQLPPVMVCISELDILKDRNLEFCKAMRMAGKSIDHRIYSGVGHAFQVLNQSQYSQAKAHEMIAHIKAFISTR